eukprot:scpid56232/ scgid12337/ Insulin-like growth factor-binding protein complex acid labile subunit
MYSLASMPSLKWIVLLLALSSWTCEGSRVCGSCVCSSAGSLSCTDGQADVSIPPNPSRVLQVPDDAFGTTPLQSLSLPGNNLMNMNLGDNALDNSVQSLMLLNLSSNMLFSVPAAVSKLQAVHTLDMSSNSISILAANSLSSLTHLRILKLNGNQLQSLPANLLATTTQLEKLYLSKNGLSSLPRNLFAGPRSTLRHLYLRENLLKSAALDSLVNCAALRTLDLSHNSIQAVHAHHFQSLIHLRTLKLTRNLLTSLPTRVFGAGVHLRELHLGANHITNLGSQNLAGYTNLHILNVSGNPLAADGTSGVTLPSHLSTQSSAASSVFGFFATQLATSRPRGPPAAHADAQVECHESHFTCSNGICIPDGLTCDGSDDCGDLSDEMLPSCLEALLPSSATLPSSVQANVTASIQPSQVFLSPEDFSSGRSVTLNCSESTGTFLPLVSWRRQDGAKLPADRVQYSGVFLGSMTIRNVTATDAGVYECSLDLLSGKVITARADILVEEFLLQGSNSAAVVTAAYSVTSLLISTVLALFVMI